MNYYIKPGSVIPSKHYHRLNTWGLYKVKVSLIGGDLFFLTCTRLFFHKIL